MLDDPRRHIAEIMTELPRYTDKVKSGYTVVDLGANIGIMSAHFAMLGARKVLAVEASKRHFDILADRVKTYPAIVPVNAAIWVYDGTVRFMEDPNNFTMDRIDYKGLTANQNIVKCTTIASLLDDHEISRVNFLKMDIEGAELDVLSHPSFAFAADKIDSMWVEVHNYKDWGPADEIYKQVEAAVKPHFPVISQNTWGWLYATKE